MELEASSQWFGLPARCGMDGYFDVNMYKSLHFELNEVQKAKTKVKAASSGYVEADDEGMDFDI